MTNQQTLQEAMAVLRKNGYRAVKIQAEVPTNFSYIDFNKDAFEACKKQGLNFNSIPEDEWEDLYELAKTDYDGAIGEVVSLAFVN